MCIFSNLNKNIRILIISFIFSYCSLAQTIFTESIGSVGATTAIASHETANGFDNDAFTMDHGGSTNAADVRNSSASTTYSGASGGANVWFTSTSGEYGFCMKGIDASACSMLTLSFGVRKEGAAATAFATLNLEFSTNLGTSWTSVAFTSPSSASGAGWYLISGISLPSAAQVSNLWIRWRKTGTIACRLDDITLTRTCGSITTGIVSSGPFTVDCSTTDDGSVAFTSSGTFNAGNTYTAQLSNSSGSFSSPVNIGSLSSTSTSSSINFTIPAGTANGSGYKIRVISSNPAVIGSESASFSITGVNCTSGGASTCIKINEVSVDPKDGDNGTASGTGEFIEIYNTCAASVEIGCFVLCLTDFQSSSERRGECLTIPSGTTLAGGAVYVFGGTGTTSAGDDWPGAAVDFNWHTNYSFEWATDENAVYTSGTGNFIGVLMDDGEDISLFSSTGTFIDGITYDSGGGMTNSVTENIPALAGCSAKSITIPNTAGHTNVGSTPGTSDQDQGFGRNCNGIWSFRNRANQNMGVAESGCVLLPVTLSYFFVECLEENSLMFNWQTYSELNNDYFTLVRTTNGIDYEEIEHINGSGNSSTIKNYSIEIPNARAFSDFYYALKQTDYNGQSTYSNLIGTECRNKNEIYVFPNPSLGNFIIEGYERNTVIYVLNSVGNLISKFQTDSEITNLDLSNQANGIYFLKIETYDKSEVIKVVKN